MARPAAAERAERWRLEDERDFLVRSLADADLEHEAGDLSDADHRALKGRDEQRLAVVEAALAELDAQVAPDAVGDGEGDRPATGAPPARPKRPSSGPRQVLRGVRHRKAFALVGVLAMVGAALWLASALLAPRLPGQASSGSVALSKSERVQRQLEEGAALLNAGQLANALVAYQEVLAEEPKQPEALAESGWLEYEAGVTTRSASLIGKGRAAVTEAVRVQPDGYAGRLYLGTIILQQDHNPAGAVAEFNRFLAAGPPASLIANAAPFLRQAYTEAGQAVPGAVPATGTSTTSPAKKG